jgi:hypothetical protein
VIKKAKRKEDPNAKQYRSQGLTKRHVHLPPCHDDICTSNSPSSVQQHVLIVSEHNRQGKKKHTHKRKVGIFVSNKNRQREAKNGASTSSLKVGSRAQDGNGLVHNPFADSEIALDPFLDILAIGDFFGV